MRGHFHALRRFTELAGEMSAALLIVVMLALALVESVWLVAKLTTP